MQYVHALQMCDPTGMGNKYLMLKFTNTLPLMLFAENEYQQQELLYQLKILYIGNQIKKL